MVAKSPLVKLDDWMGSSETAAFIGVEIGTLYSWRSNPSGPKGPKSYRVGGRLKYKRSEVVAWMESNARPGDDD